MNLTEAIDLVSLGLDHERPLFRVSDILEMLANFEETGAVLYSGERSAIFTYIEDCGDGEVAVHVGPAAGDIEEIKQALPRLEELSRARGVTQILVDAGRTGWERVLKDEGYERHRVVLRKLL